MLTLFPSLVQAPAHNLVGGGDLLTGKVHDSQFFLRASLHAAIRSSGQSVQSHLGTSQDWSFSARLELTL